MAGAAAESTARDVLLVDFGGVYTTSVLAAFKEFGEDPGLPLTLLGGDDPVSSGSRAGCARTARGWTPTD